MNDHELHLQPQPVEHPRSASARLQGEIADATQEIAGGRYADVGLTLGAQVSRSLSLRQSAAEIAALKDSNSLTAFRLSMSQNVLQAVAEIRRCAIREPDRAAGGQARGHDGASANDTLASLTNLLNSSASGQRCSPASIRAPARSATGRGRRPGRRSQGVRGHLQLRAERSPRRRP